MTPEDECTFPAAKISVVDTTGAGDAFVGGLLYTLSQAASRDNRLLAQAIGTANACGAMVVTAKGR